MYCPVCFQNTLMIRQRGVIKLSFNDKARTTSLFTFNLQKDSKEELFENLKNRVEDYMKWYSTFVNKTPIQKVEVYSGDFQCINQCKIDMINNKFSVIGILYSPEEARKIVIDECNKFQIPNDVKIIS